MLCRTMGCVFFLAGLAIGSAGLAYSKPLAAVALPMRSTQQVRIRSGWVRGLVDGGLAIYRGIPYARPPVGDLRWTAPKAPAAWNGVLDATRFKPACMQKGPTLPGMMEHYSENCLFLNIWTPAKAPNQRLAVMVYIYGGGGLSGSGSARLYWGDELAKRGVVVVTFNYRIGAFGWLADAELTKQAGTSGNYGLLDIIAALKWVRANIAAFGGDPGNVTLFGQSAGAYYESALMVCPAARGLFRRIIAESGGDFGTESAHDAAFPMLSQAEREGAAFLKRLGVTNITEARRIPAGRIVALDSAMAKDGVSPLHPNIDGHLIPGPVRTLFREGKQVPADLLVGSNADEGVNPAFGPLLSAAAFREELRARYGNFEGRFLRMYPAESAAEAKQSELRLKSDFVSWLMASWAAFQSKREVRRVYLYRFSTIPPFFPWVKLRAAGHGAELTYVFGFPPVELLRKFESPDQAALHIRIEDEIQSYWTNFAKTGDPNGPGLPRWPTFSSSSERILDMGNTFTAGRLPNRTALALFDAYHNSDLVSRGRRLISSQSLKRTRATGRSGS